MFAPAAPQLMALKGNASRFLNVSAAAMRSNTLPSLQGVTVAPPLPDQLEPSKTKITTLPNGVKIASETSPIVKIKEDIAEAVNNPQGVLFEELQSAPYSGALQNSLFIPECFLFRMDGTMLDEFVVENYTAPRMVLAASGVDHEEFLSIAEPLLSDLPAVSRPVEPHSSYVGGICFNTTISAAIDIALAFEVPGGWKTEKDAMTSTVLQMLMGGGGSFTAGGPGKRMFLPLRQFCLIVFGHLITTLNNSAVNLIYMRKTFYQRVLNEYQEIKSFSAFNIIFNSTGIFGIHAITEHKFAPQAVEIMAREFLEVATPGKVKQVDLDRAKSAIKSAVFMNLESRMVAAEDIGRQILTYGERKPGSYFLKAIDAVTLEDIASTAQKLISSPLTMGTIGDVGEILTYESVSSMFH